MEHSRNTTRHGAVRRLVLAFAVCIAAPAGATVYVSNYGVDAGGCGTSATPCRNINYAIGVAAVGDTILVGPGTYRESGSIACTSVNTAMICVDKHVTILSTLGAANTVIDGFGGASRDAVQISADGVVFGKKKKGFTLRTNYPTGGQNGLLVEADGVRVEGNIFASNYYGVWIESGTGVTVARNLTLLSTEQSMLVFAGGTVVDSNTAQSAGSGIAASADGVVVKGNVVTATGTEGIGLEGTDIQVIGNSSIGNGQGVRVYGPATGAVVSGNDLYANYTGCGIAENVGPSVTLAATGNFWGAASGPGLDPADGLCAGSGITVPTFAPAAIKVKGVGALP
jgi:hypothetical protein